MATGLVTINIVGDASRLKGALNESESALGRFGQKMQAVGANLTTKLTVPLAAAFGFAAKSAADEEKEVAVLANTLRQTTGATQKQLDANEKWITSMQNATGVADSQLRTAMGKLLIAGRSVEQSHKDLAVAADIAAARHIDLDTVVTAMSKAAQGQTTSLQRLGIATKDAAGEALTYDQILANASKTMGGAAAAAADTTAGKFEILKLKMQDMAESIGSALIPVIDRLASWLGTIADWFSNLPSSMQTFIVVLGLIAAALGPVITLIGTLTTVITFLAANPVVLIIAGIAALAVGLVIAYQKCEAFRNIVDAVADVFQWLWHNALEPVIAFIRDYVIPIVADVAGRYFAAWATVIGTVVDAFRTLVGWLKTAWDWIGKLVSPLEKVLGLLSKLPSSIPGVGGSENVGPGKQKSILGFATGGVVPGPMGAAQLALVHGGEAVFTPDQLRALGSVGGGSSVTNVTINTGLDPTAVMAALARFVRSSTVPERVKREFAP